MTREQQARLEGLKQAEAIYRTAKTGAEFQSKIRAAINKAEQESSK